MKEILDWLAQNGNSVKAFTIIIILLLTVIISKSIKRLLQNHAQRARLEPTQSRFMSYFLSAIVYLIGTGFIIYMIPPLRALSVSMLAGAGILAIVIGFASQQAFGNLVSGIFIIASKPYRIGDVIKVSSGTVGSVEDITLRHTVIKTFENKRVIIPNSSMNSDVIENYNIGDPKLCKYIEFGISYDSDIDLAMKIMKELSEKHPDCLDHRSEEQKKNKEPKVRVKVIGFGDSSVNIRAWVWAKDSSSAFRMGCDLKKSIKERFDREGVEIPFPYRTIVYKKDIKKPKKSRKKKR